MFFRYLREQLAAILLVIAVAGIFAALSWLYGAGGDAALYGLLLSGVVCAAALIIGYVIWYRRRRELWILMDSEEVHWEDLPGKPRGIAREYTALMEKQDRYIKKLVRRADARRAEQEDYYALWAHQIKTPIAAMSVLLQQTEGGNTLALRTELFKVERYAEMVMQYLRADAMSGDMSFGEYSVEDMVNQAVKKYAPLFIGGGVRLENGNLDCRAVTDEKWLVFVLEQIISNAVKYAPGGVVRIYMDGDTDLRVEDNGIGINREDLPRVFERGFTGFNGRMDKKSTGIGLYLSKRVMDTLGHGIFIESQPGRGTRVTLRLTAPQVILQ